MLVIFKINIFVLLVSMGLCLSCEQSTSGKRLPDDLRIAYNVLVDAEKDNYDIFTMKCDGSYKTNITNHPDVAWTYLATGDRIFFISDRDTAYRHYFLYDMGSDGRGITSIYPFRLADSWMGTRKLGTELIVKPHPSVDTALHIIHVDGTLIKKLGIAGMYLSDPSFSPDGAKIAFVGKNKRSKREEGYKEAIYISDDDGSNLVKVSKYPESDTTAEWYAYKAGPPRWHPTEDFVSYQSKRNGKYSLYAAMTNGSREWKLTDLEQQEGWHDWSPNGRWLAIELFDADQTQFDIGLYDWETKELRVLTDSTYQYQQAPVFVK